MITPPLNLVIYAETESPEFLNIVTLIAQNTNQDETQAQAIYNDWLTTVRHEEVIRIESVGEIREKRFYPAQGLNEIMNPIRPEPVKMPHQMGVRQIVLWVIGAVIIGGAISYGAITLLNRSTYSYEEDLTEWNESDPATSAAPSSELATDHPAATTDEATNGPATTATPAPAPKPARHLSHRQNRPFQPRQRLRLLLLDRWAIMLWLARTAAMQTPINSLRRQSGSTIRFRITNCRLAMAKL